MPRLIELLESRVLFTGPFGVGEHVAVTASALNVRAAPAGAVLGTQPADRAGTVVGGPTTAALNGATYTWYDVDWTTGADGWSADTYLVKLPPAAPAPASPGAAASPGPVLATAAPALSWSAVPGATGYGVYVKDSAAGTLVYANDAVGNVTSVTPPALAAGRRYQWNVRATNAGGAGPFSPLRYFQTPAAAPASMTYQAESAARSGVTVVSDYAGYTGSGFARYGSSGSYVQWSVGRAAAGNAKLTFRYANGSTVNRTMTVRVNGVGVVRVPFAPTGGWATWKSVSVTARLNAGANTVRATAEGNGGPNVDALAVAAVAPNLKLDRAKFLSLYSTAYGSLTSSQSAGLNQLLGFIEADADVTDVRWAAYMLATAKHEVANTWRPIEEYGKGAGRPYGQLDPATGYAYYGRGYVQLTWAGNYQKLGAAIGVDLYRDPTLALRPDVAYKVMSYGMRMGSFTGVGLAWYVNEAKTDYANARRIINGTDVADRIAGYATKLESLLRQSAVS